MDTHISMKSNNNYETNLMRKSIEDFRHKKMSMNTWRKVENLWGRKINNSFINSGLSMIDDFLLSTPQGHNLFVNFLNLIFY